MRSPWHNKSGLAKATAILATILSIAVGLCGMNYGAFFLASRLRPSNSWVGIGNLLVFTSFAELAVILLSGAGLLIVLLIVIGKLVGQGFSAGQKGDD
jgi:hypothetical protein